VVANHPAPSSHSQEPGGKLPVYSESDIAVLSEILRAAEAAASRENPNTQDAGQVSVCNVC